ncbi:MAG: hypothetical protein F4X98_19100 [Gammaproteobacteria bacterium]|nr:hypothetical protein [Gammaproteobacteria bacterium]
MAELASLKLECGGHAFTTRLDVLNWEVNERVAALRIDEVDDTSAYWEYRNIVEDAHYQDAWLMARCLAVPTEAWRRTGAFESLFPFEYRGPPWTDVANPHDVIGSRDGFHDRRWLEHNISQETEGYRLMLTAARLGSEWALAQVAGMFEEFAEEMDAAHPVLGQIMRVKYYAGYVGSMDDATKRGYRSRHAANAVRLAEHHGIELDMARLSALVEGRTSLYTPPPTPSGRAPVDHESTDWVVDAIRKDGAVGELPKTRQ